LTESALAHAAETAERLREAVQNLRFVVRDQQAHVTISIGIAVQDDMRTAEGLIGAADNALYAAKHAGRNRIHIAGAAVEPLTRRVG